ncbi:hypothetical protein BB558_004538 [Smittium angustum]|nr:hypothetical protein BB558_004538 [Smittium angustum]
MSLYFAVLEGGNFDIDFSIRDPLKSLVINEQTQRQGNLVFTANEIGEYGFCFSNKMSTIVDKLVDFEITVEDEARDPDLKSRNSNPAGDFGASRIYGDLHNIDRFQLYFKARENRNYNTVLSTEQRIWWYALLESSCVVLVAVLQVFSIQALFTAKKSRF